jgi:hypothetical protein
MRRNRMRKRVSEREREREREREMHAGQETDRQTAETEKRDRNATR